MARTDAAIKDPALLLIAIVLGSFDGANIISMGLALPRISKLLHLDATQGGLCASAAMFGLMIGAPVAGRLADRFGRRPVLIGTMLLMSLFSFCTTLTWDFESTMICRFIAGLGMGGLMPILVAMARSSAGERFRSTAISMLMASGGIGAILVSAIALYPDWRMIFYFGGIGPLVMLPVLLLMASPDRGGDGHERSTMSMADGLFGGNRVTGTLLIWSISFCTVLCSYVLVNWLPSLLIRRGFTEDEAHIAMIVYSVGGILGNICAGAMADRGSLRFSYIVFYIGAAVCICTLTLIDVATAMYLLVFLTNFFILGAQLVTVSYTPTYYPTQARTTGIGAMVSAGRGGSVIGPLAVGLLLHAGLSANFVLLCLTPAMLIPLLLGIVLANRHRTHQPKGEPQNMLENA